MVQSEKPLVPLNDRKLCLPSYHPFHSQATEYIILPWDSYQYSHHSPNTQYHVSKLLTSLSKRIKSRFGNLPSRQLLKKKEADKIIRYQWNEVGRYYLLQKKDITDIAIQLNRISGSKMSTKHSRKNIQQAKLRSVSEKVVSHLPTWNTIPIGQLFILMPLKLLAKRIHLSLHRKFQRLVHATLQRTPLSPRWHFSV